MVESDNEQVGEKNNDPDRILKTNQKGTKIKRDKNGNAKVAVDGIAQGILKDGMNFKDKNNLFSVGDKKPLSINDVDAFALKFSQFLGVELRGTYFSKDGTGNVTDISIGSYSGATSTKAANSGVNLKSPLQERGELEEIFKYKAVGFYHTHPTISNAYHDDKERFNPSDKDKATRDIEHQKNPSMKHYILT